MKNIKNNNSNKEEVQEKKKTNSEEEEKDKKDESSQVNFFFFFHINKDNAPKVIHRLRLVSWLITFYAYEEAIRLCAGFVAAAFIKPFTSNPETFRAGLFALCVAFASLIPIGAISYVNVKIASKTPQKDEMRLKQSHSMQLKAFIGWIIVDLLITFIQGKWGPYLLLVLITSKVALWSLGYVMFEWDYIFTDKYLKDVRVPNKSEVVETEIETEKFGKIKSKETKKTI